MQSAPFEASMTSSRFVISPTRHSMFPFPCVCRWRNNVSKDTTRFAPRSSISTSRIPHRPVPPVTKHVSGTGGYFFLAASFCIGVLPGARGPLCLSGRPPCWSSCQNWFPSPLGSFSFRLLESSTSLASCLAAYLGFN